MEAKAQLVECVCVYVRTREYGEDEDEVDECDRAAPRVHK